MAKPQKSFLKRLNIWLNPFDVVRFKGKKNKPDSRSLQTSFATKVEDTYLAIRGGIHIDSALIYKISRKNAEIMVEKALGKRPKTAPLIKYPSREKIYPPLDLKKIRIGLFDYATAGLFIALHALYDNYIKFVHYDVSKASTAKKLAHRATFLLTIVPMFPLVMMHFFGNGLLRPGVAKLTTRILIPFIFVAHKITDFIRWIKEKQLENLEVEAKDETPLADTLESGYKIEQINSTELVTKKLKEVIRSQRIANMYAEVDSSNVNLKDSLLTLKLYDSENNKKLVGTKKFNLNNQNDTKALGLFMEINPHVRRAFVSNKHMSPRGPKR